MPFALKSHDQRANCAIKVPILFSVLFLFRRDGRPPEGEVRFRVVILRF